MTDTHEIQVSAPAEIRPKTVMHPLVSAAIQSGSLDPATLKQLLDVQREWEAGEAKKEFARAMTALKRDLPTVIRRDQKVDFGTSKGRTTYTHTSLAAAMEAVTGPLCAHGFAISWTPAVTDRGSVRVTCRLTHSGGHSEEATLEAPADTSGNKSPSQGVASTVTLLSRYTALALLGIATADMADPSAPDLSTVDTRRNLRAAGRLVKAGLTRSDGEARLGKTVEQWTMSDLFTIDELISEKGAVNGE